MAVALKSMTTATSRQESRRLLSPRPRRFSRHLTFELLFRGDLGHDTVFHFKPWEESRQYQYLLSEVLDQVKPANSTIRFKLL